jgi:hypothetical protein
VTGGEQAAEDVLFGEPVGLVVHPLPPFVLHHAALDVQLLGRDLREQPPHPVAVEPQHQRQGVGRAGLVVVGAVLGGGPVVVGARGLEEPVEVARRYVLRAHEHDVLEQVREAGAAGALVPRPDVVPDVDRDDRHGTVLVHDDRETVRQREPLMRDAQLLRGELDGQRRHQERRGDGTPARRRAGGSRLSFHEDLVKRNATGHFRDSATT